MGQKVFGELNETVTGNRFEASTWCGSLNSMLPLAFDSLMIGWLQRRMCALWSYW
mgnify:FL=1